MKKPLFFILATLTLPLAGRSEPFEQAKVTRTVNQVNLLKDKQAPQPANTGDVVNGSTALKTGGDSRAELQFPDFTITRVGANALFRFHEGGREMTLDGGTILFSAPKGQGGGQVQAGAVTAAVTGTSFLLSYVIGGEVKVIVLEGKVLIFLTSNPTVRKVLHAGEIGVLPAGGKTFTVYSIDLRQVLLSSRLLEAGGFAPLNSQALLWRVAETQKGKIKRLPDGLVANEQTAQIIRNTINAGGPPPKPPKPMVTPLPPAPTPVPTPRPRPPDDDRPPPSPHRPHGD